ncbi:histidine kinase N-terminal domain-containing protein [Calidifontibacillus erzurumensis]|uniref:histidine kinase n=1 Tax=Calidifontibacillus erzurumensis TaxID=2741433 RepID=A0A8J8GBW0_9BACI|nr:histidine kinase N-terminal domain-containing protein [Calidifontibacillus erzurumensis]NSL50959.1 GHKL domain-containing protein [Calidifontibacillus erzurumensis]
MKIKLKSNENGFNNTRRFLIDNKEEILKLWGKELKVNTNSNEKESIRKNGALLYELLLRSLGNNISEEDIKLLAYNVAKERADMNINIGCFIYNVNLERSMILKYINQSGLPLEEIIPTIEIINKQFDLFCYFAVTRYTELIDLKLQEKNLIISRSHNDRLAILGQMSSSFVHEFRNPLTSVIGFVKLLKNDNPDMPYLDIISKELEQLKFRITQFLHISKMNIVNESKFEMISMKSLIEEVADFLYPSIVDGNINISSRIDPEAIVFGDKNELKQVFLNILMNAIDAVRENKGERNITIHTDINKEIVSISIINNGPPISAETLKLIFEPFYTTKKLGTGIGLYVSKNIIENHNGKISCFSNNEKTMFQIKLPIYKDQEESIL